MDDFIIGAIFVGFLYIGLGCSSIFHCFGNYLMGFIFGVRVDHYFYYFDPKMNDYGWISPVFNARVIPFNKYFQKWIINTEKHPTLDGLERFKFIILSISGIIGVLGAALIFNFIAHMHDGTYFKSCVVESVYDYSAFYGARPQVGDKIVGINENEVSDYMDLILAIKDYKEVNSISIRRGGEILTLRVVAKNEIDLKSSLFEEGYLGVELRDFIDIWCILNTALLSLLTIVSSFLKFCTSPFDSIINIGLAYPASTTGYMLNIFSQMCVLSGVISVASTAIATGIRWRDAAAKKAYDEASNAVE